ncbi:MAG: hypothetical protein ACREAY_00500 [Nitrososphaera sp.]|uniref:hypothetical protein n=1 Tax=Nitrososphaera sp. TaxID=1971748 RepID=UPI003D6E5AAB
MVVLFWVGLLLLVTSLLVRILLGFSDHLAKVVGIVLGIGGFLLAILFASVDPLLKTISGLGIFLVIFVWLLLYEPKDIESEIRKKEEVEEKIRHEKMFGGNFVNMEDEKSPRHSK